MSIVAQVQSQLLQTLFKALDLTTLKDGQELIARVLSTTSDGKATLDLGGNQITANFQNASGAAASLVPGARIILKYDNSGKEPKLVLVDRAPVEAIVDRSQFSAQDEQQFTQLSLALEANITSDAPTPIQLVKFVEPAVALRAEAILTAPTPRVVLLQNLITAVTNQGSMGNIIADIEALFSEPTAQSSQSGTIPLQLRPLPAPLYDAINALMSQQLDGELPVAAGDIRQALKQSGLFFEAKLQNGEIPLPNTDLKAALLALRDITKLMQTMSLFKDDEQSGIREKHEAVNTNSFREAPMPPRRDSLPQSQRLHTSPLESHFSTADAARILEKHADQALERIKLMQFASLPPSPINPSSGDISKLKNQIWAFELPISLPKETTIAGFKIEHEQKNSPEYSEKIWRVNFAIETQELGSVHGRIGIQGKNLNITLFADRATTSDAFREHLSDLRQALNDSDFELSNLSVLTGKPSEPSAKPGLFVDNAA